MNTPTENYSALILKIDEFIRKYYLNKIVRGSLYLIATLLTGYIVVTLFEYYGNFSPWIRAVLFFGFILLQLVVFFVLLLGPLLSYFRLGKRISYHQASVIIGRHFPFIKDKLINTIQLKELAENSAASKLIIESAISQKISELKPVPFQSAIRIRENRRYLRYALPPLFIIALIGITAPYMLSEGTERIIYYTKPYIRKAPFRFVLINKDLTVLQGEDLTLEVKLLGKEVPDIVYIEDGVNTFKIEKRNVVHFKHTFKNIQKSKTIRFLGGGFFSESIGIKVQQKPAIVDAEVTILYPEYLKRKNEKRSSLSDLTVPAGTRLNYRLSGNNLDSLLVYQEPGKTQRLTRRNNSEFQFALTAIEPINLKVLSDGKYRGVNKQQVPLVSFKINVTPDEVPSIQISERKDSLDGQMSFFIGQVNDDHGFTDLKIKYQIRDESGLSAMRSKVIPIDRHTVQQSFFQAVTASDFKLQPGQELEFYFEVRDNDLVNGPKVSKTDVIRLSVPSIAVANKKAEQGRMLVEAKLKQAIKVAAEIELEAKRLHREFAGEKTLSYSQRKQLADLVQKQRDLEALLKKTKEESASSRPNKKDLSASTQAGMLKQQQIEKLIDQAFDDKTQALLRDIEKMLQENKKTGTSQEISSIQSGSKALQKELDRIFSLYKQLEFEQMLSQVIDDLNVTAADQKKLASEISTSGSNQRKVIQEQQSLSDRFERISLKLNVIEKKNKELQSSHQFGDTESDRKGIIQAQSRSRSLASNSNNAQAQKEMETAAAKIEALASKLEESRDNFQSAESRVSLRSLNQIIDNLLKSSFDQEQLLTSTKGSQPGDPLFSSYIKTQIQIKENLKNIGDSLYTLSRVIPQIESAVTMEIGNASSSVNSALEGLGERRMNEAAKYQQNAMTSMNNLALLLGEVREQLDRAMKNASSKGQGKQNSLSGLIQQQDLLNKNMQKAREQLKQNGQQNGKQRGERAVSEKMGQLAREQNLIRMALESFNRNLLRNGVNDLGNLEKLTKDMEQTEADLVNRKIQLQTMARQQDILTRLLQAEKSDREREQDDRRESREGRDADPVAIPLLNKLEKMRANETDYLRTIPLGLNSFYQLKVGDYFRSLTSK